MDDVAIRRAVPAEADEIAEHQTICWREAYTGIVPSAYLDDTSRTTRRVERWRTLLNRPGEVDAWVAESDVAIVGVARAGPARDPDAPTVVELMSIYVRRHAQGRGVGSRLLEAAIGRQPASLWVFAANESARAFYVRHGFEADGTDKVDEDTGVPEIRMVRAVRRPGC